MCAICARSLIMLGTIDLNQLGRRAVQASPLPKHDLQEFVNALATGWTDEAQLVRRFRLLRAPVQLRRKPSCEENSSRSESRGEVDSEFPEFGKMMMRRRMIKKLRQREAHIIQSRPIQVTKHDALFRFLFCGLH